MMLPLQSMPPPADWGVSVDEDALRALAVSWAPTAFPLPQFDYPGVPAERAESWWFDYVTLSVSVLACLWPPEGGDMWTVEFDGAHLDDAPAVFAAFTRVIQERGLDLGWFASLTDEDGAAIFAGDGTLQLIPERVDTLRSVARTLIERWDASAANLVDAAERDGHRIVELLSTTVDAYCDRPSTPAGIAHFDKLAHLAAALMVAGVGWHDAGFHGYEDFPVYPDYMLPRVFRHYGAMHYSSDLARLVDQRGLVGADSNAEYAIRWATVYCGAVLSNTLAELGTAVSGPALDYRLWSVAVLGPDADAFGEHHRTLTLRY